MADGKARHWLSKPRASTTRPGSTEPANYHSDALKVVERITARSADTLNYEATIEDPKVFTRPWKISMPLYRRVEKDARVIEFKCIEYTEELLYGHLRKQPGNQ